MARELLPGGSSALQPLMYDTANPCSFQLITNSVNRVVYNPFAQSSRRVAYSFSWLTIQPAPAIYHRFKTNSNICGGFG